jgi:LPS-assembly lipoprotein
MIKDYKMKDEPMKNPSILVAIIRSSLIYSSFILLTACGFSPIYAQNQANQSSFSALSDIAVDTIPGRMGQQLKADLEDRLNPSGTASSPNYRLAVSLAQTESPIGIARDGTVSRYNVYLDANYSLKRIEDGTVVKEGKIRQVSSYNNVTTGAYFSTYISQEDAIKRGITELAEGIRQRLSMQREKIAPKP